MNKICQDNNAKFMLGIIPIAMEFDSTLNNNEIYDRGMIANLIKEISVKNDIPFGNFYESLKLESNPLSIYLIDDPHFNLKGHKWMSEKLFDFIKRNENSH